MGSLAVQGCTVQITSGQQAASVAIVTQPSSAVKVNSKGVYFGDIDVQLTTLSQGNLTCPGGTITISGTVEDVCELSGESSKPAVQEGDEGEATLTFTDSSTGSPTPVNVKIKITNAGQSDVTVP